VAGEGGEDGGGEVFEAGVRVGGGGGGVEAGEGLADRAAAGQEDAGVRGLRLYFLPVMLCAWVEKRLFSSGVM